MSFLQLQEKRRTIYALGNQLPVEKETINTLVKNTVRQTPSAFNSQSTRAVVLHGAEHEALWDIVTEILRAKVPAESFAPTEAKMKGFRAGAGTVLFFEDQSVVQQLQEQFPSYAASFPDFSEQGGGMAQYAVWLALAEINVGANLQHYNPIIDDQVKARWNLPASWKLRSQMVFGNIVQPAGVKTFVEDDVRFKVFG